MYSLNFTYNGEEASTDLAAIKAKSLTELNLITGLNFLQFFENGGHNFIASADDYEKRLEYVLKNTDDDDFRTNKQDFIDSITNEQLDIFAVKE